MWRRIKDLKKQHMLPWNCNKLNDKYQSGKGYKVISKDFWTPVNQCKSHDPQVKKTWNSFPSRGWPIQNNSNSSSITHPRGHKNTTCKTLQASLKLRKRVSRPEPHLKKKNTKVRVRFPNKHLDHLRLLEKYSMDWRDKSESFWEIYTIDSAFQEEKLNVWGLFAGSGTGQLAVVVRTINSVHGTKFKHTGYTGQYSKTLPTHPDWLNKKQNWSFRVALSKFGSHRMHMLETPLCGWIKFLHNDVKCLFSVK